MYYFWLGREAEAFHLDDFIDAMNDHFVAMQVREEKLMRQEWVGEFS
jgi:hypothetical protein